MCLQLLLSAQTLALPIICALATYQLVVSGLWPAWLAASAGAVLDASAGADRAIAGAAEAGAAAVESFGRNDLIGAAVNTTLGLADAARGALEQAALAATAAAAAAAAAAVDGDKLIHDAVNATELALAGAAEASSGAAKVVTEVIDEIGRNGFVRDALNATAAALAGAAEVATGAPKAIADVLAEIGANEHVRDAINATVGLAGAAQLVLEQAAATTVAAAEAAAHAAAAALQGDQTEPTVEERRRLESDGLSLERTIREHGAPAFEWLKGDRTALPPEPLWPALAALLVSYAIARAFAALYEGLVDSVLVCALRDADQYGAKYTSEALSEALGLSGAQSFGVSAEAAAGRFKGIAATELL